MRGAEGTDGRGGEGKAAVRVPGRRPRDLIRVTLRQTRVTLRLCLTLSACRIVINEESMSIARRSLSVFPLHSVSQVVPPSAHRHRCLSGQQCLMFPRSHGTQACSFCNLESHGTCSTTTKWSWVSRGLEARTLRGFAAARQARSLDIAAAGIAMAQRNKVRSLSRLK